MKEALPREGSLDVALDIGVADSRRAVDVVPALAAGSDFALAFALEAHPARAVAVRMRRRYRKETVLE